MENPLFVTCHSSLFSVRPSSRYVTQNEKWELPTGQFLLMCTLICAVIEMLFGPLTRLMPQPWSYRDIIQLNLICISSFFHRLTVHWDWAVFWLQMVWTLVRGKPASQSACAKYTLSYSNWHNNFDAKKYLVHLMHHRLLVNGKIIFSCLNILICIATAHFNTYGLTDVHKYSTFIQHGIEIVLVEDSSTTGLDALQKYWCVIPVLISKKQTCLI